jgi:hypothetical protein
MRDVCGAGWQPPPAWLKELPDVIVTVDQEEFKVELVMSGPNSFKCRERIKGHQIWIKKKENKDAIHAAANAYLASRLPRSEWAPLELLHPEGLPTSRKRKADQMEGEEA